MTIQEMDPELTAFARDASGGELYTTTTTQTYDTCSVDRKAKALL